jgi:hypothetical protein
MRIGVGEIIYGDRAVQPARTEGSSERNKFGRPYPWYCSVVGWTGLNSECDPPSDAQIKNEFDMWYRDGVESGKLDPAVTEDAYEAARAALEADIARNEKLNSWAPDLSTLASPLYLVAGALILVGVIVAVKKG